ncbi:helix-turn-helix domain-containing protein, partial [Clostridioides difficile]
MNSVNKALFYIDKLSFCFLLINRNYMSIEAMAEELNLSIAAINKLSSKLKRKLEKYDLVI